MLQEDSAVHLSVTTTRDHQELEQEGPRSSHAYAELINIGYLVDWPGVVVVVVSVTWDWIHHPRGPQDAFGGREGKERDHMTGTTGHWHGGLR